MQFVEPEGEIAGRQRRAAGQARRQDQDREHQGWRRMRLITSSSTSSRPIRACLMATLRIARRPMAIAPTASAPIATAPIANVPSRQRARRHRARRRAGGCCCFCRSQSGSRSSGPRIVTQSARACQVASRVTVLTSRSGARSCGMWQATPSSTISAWPIRALSQAS